MKKLSVILLFFFSLSMIFTSCKKEETEPVDQNILPSGFTVEIPNALVADAYSTQKGTKSDILNGNVVYYHLSTFILVGQEASQIVADIISNIRLLNLSQPMSFTYQSKDDGKAKNVVITENSVFNEETWQYQMNIVDADSSANDDGGMAVQIFWNKSPIKGIVIIKPKNLNHNVEALFANSMLRIDYTEGGDVYEKEMTVYINGLVLDNPLNNPYSMETLKMNVGKKGNTIEVYGNSNHPNAHFYTEDTGFNWAFVAAGSNVSDLAVAEVGLPYSELQSDNRGIILGEYSIKNVLTAQINEMYPDLDPLIVATYLANTEAPAYFNNTGFVQGGTAPNANYAEFETAIESLVPYSPYAVTNLSINFKGE